MRKVLPKLLVVGITLIFLSQLCHAGPVSAFRKFKPVGRKKQKSQAARVAESQLSLPVKETYYNWDAAISDWDLAVVYENKYDDKGNLIMQVGFSEGGDSLSKEVHKYNAEGEETEYSSYHKWGEEGLVPEYRESYTYDPYGRPLEYLSQVYYKITGNWENELKLTGTYSSTVLEYPDNYSQYQWDGLAWKLTNKGANITWKDFDNGDILSGYVTVYNEEILATTYSTDEAGTTTGIIEQFDFDVFIPVGKTISTKDEGGNVFTILQIYMNGEYQNYTKTIDLFDEHGNYSGFSVDGWTGEDWDIVQYHVYNNVYNSNNDLVETNRISYNLDGEGNIEKTKSVYSDFVVISGIQNSLHAELSRFAYPNPVTELVNIENKSGEEIQFSLYNLQNKLMLSSRTSGGKATISMDDLPSGIYLLKSVTSSGKLYTEKLVKE